MREGKGRGAQARRRALSEPVLQPRPAPWPLRSSRPGTTARPRPRSPRVSRGAAAPPQPGSTPPCPADAARCPRSPRPLRGAEPGAGSHRRRGRGRPLPPGGREPPGSSSRPSSPRGRLLGTCCSASSRACPPRSAPSSASLQGSFHRRAPLAQPGDARGSRPSDLSCPHANAPLALGGTSPFPSPPPATWLPNWGVWVSPSTEQGGRGGT